MAAVKTRTVPAVHKALGILELLTESREGMTLPEVVVQSNMAKSSAHYLLVTLERCGYVCRSARNGRYMLGVKVFSMANSAADSSILRQQTAPYLRGVMMRTGLTVQMSVLDRNEAILVVKQEPQRGTRLASWIGKRMDMHCTSLGKATLAFLPKAEIDEIIRKRGLSRHNENTIANLRQLNQELERIANLGYALDDQEDELGIRSIGVPVFGQDGRPFAAISVGGSTSELLLEEVPRLANDLLRIATGISRTVSTAHAVSSELNLARA